MVNLLNILHFVIWVIANIPFILSIIATEIEFWISFIHFQTFFIILQASNYIHWFIFIILILEVTNSHIFFKGSLSFAVLPIIVFRVMHWVLILISVMMLFGFAPLILSKIIHLFLPIFLINLLFVLQFILFIIIILNLNYLLLVINWIALFFILQIVFWYFINKKNLMLKRWVNNFYLKILFILSEVLIISAFLMNKINLFTIVIWVVQ